MGIPNHWDPTESIPGFPQLFGGFVEGYSKIVSPLMDCPQVNNKEGKKGSQKHLPWGPEHQTAFDSIKARLCGQLLLQRVNPDKPFVLRTDASGYAVGASLEQMVDELRMPTLRMCNRRKLFLWPFCHEN